MKIISLNNWCFEENEVVKLIWIDEPYLQEGQWKVAVYFKSLTTNKKERIIVDWGTIALLKIGELYQSGTEKEDKSELEKALLKSYNDKVDSFTLDGSKLDIKTKLYDMKIKDSIVTLKLKSFVYKHNSNEYHIPVIEVLRSLIARNKRLLYASLKPNSLFELFSWHTVDDNLIISPTKNYPKYLLKVDNHVHYIAWLLTNKDANRTWGAIYENQLTKKEIEFPFPIQNEFTISARYKKVNEIIRIEQIYDFAGAEIDYSIIEVRNVTTTSTNTNKSLNKVSKTYEGETVSVTAEKGARKKESSINNKLGLFKVANQAKIQYSSTSDTSDNSNKVKNIREKVEFQKASLADTLSSSNAYSLEFDEDNNEIVNVGDLHQMIDVLDNIQQNFNVEVSYTVKELPKVEKRCSFRYKADGEIRRYLLAQIKIDSKYLYLIEIEREEKSLSTLVLYENDYQQVILLDSKVDNIVKGLLNNNGCWDQESIVQQGVEARRLRHHRGNNINTLSLKYYRKLATK